MSITGWTVEMCRETPGAEDVAILATARGATVCWCGPDCACKAVCGQEDDDG